MSQRVTTFQIEEVLPTIDRLDTYLRKRIANVSRGRFQRLIEEGLITVNGAVVKPTHHPRLGEEVVIRWPEIKPLEAKPQEIPLDILYEDEDLLVLNKKPGMVVHPAVGNEENTLVNALLHHCKGQLSGIAGVARPGIVHRLDKDTTGCLVVAKNDESHSFLAEQFSNRTVEKTYWAIVCGQNLPNSGEIYAAIARHPNDRKKMAVTDGKGRMSRTSFKVLEKLKGSCLVEAYLHTGRTHQIRVHFQHLKHPLVGDEIYGKKESRKLFELTKYKAPRQMLHAYKLSFVHFKTGEIIKAEAPLPEDFEKALKKLRSA